jgi:NADPH:quinone reductase-like Zn-dependent oxidoreductase
MKAIVQTDYGSTEQLRLAEVDRPTVSNNGVLVQVKAASVNGGDWHLMRGTPFPIRLMFGGILKPKGTYILVGGSITRFFQVMLFESWISKISGRKVQCLASKPNQADLMTLRDLLEAGKIVPFIDRHFNLSEVPKAINYLEQRQVLGKIAISI